MIWDSLPEQAKLGFKKPLVELVSWRLTALTDPETNKKLYDWEDFNIVSSDGKEMGSISLKYYKDRKFAEIEGVVLEKEFTNQGLGKEVYKQAIQRSREHGCQLRSSSNITGQALRVWESLKKEGLVEEIDGQYYAKE